ncbi:MAG: hypothetical protein ACE14L_14990 [Terriglobales bacterium]
MPAAITFDQMERSADRTLAAVYWAKHLENVVACAVGLTVLNRTLRRFVRSLDSGLLESLTTEQAADLKTKLQTIHSNLASRLRECQTCAHSCNWISRAALKGIEASTEDIGDIIENLSFSRDPQFRSLLRDSVQAIADPAAHVGGV